MSAAAPGAAEREPLLVHLVSNGVRGDSRVIKSAKASQAAGIPTLIVGVSPTAEHQRLELEGVPVLLVPHPPPTSSLRRDRRNAPRNMKEWVVEGGFLVLRRRPNVRAKISQVAGRARRAAPVDEQPQSLSSLGALGSTSAAWAKPLLRFWLSNSVMAQGLLDLQPTAIHVHDAQPLPAAVAYRRSLEKTGGSVAIVYDAHEWVSGLARVPSPPPSYLGMDEAERAFIGEADAVITVSAEMSRLIAADRGLSKPPAVVLNAPETHDVGDSPSLRESIGLGPDVPLMVYSGWVDAERGVGTAIAALPSLPGVHLALVVGSRNAALSGALSRAVALGVADRVHLAGYVSPAHVSHYLSSADVGLIPRSGGDHLDVSLPTKFREYLHAHLPLVVSDNKQMTATVTEHGVGESFHSGDVAGFVSAVTKVLDDPQSYRDRITDDLLREHSWEAQVPVLLEVYRSVGIVPTPSTRPERAAEAWAPVSTEAVALEPGRRHVSLAVGPVNSAGQATAWAHAARRLGITATSFGGTTGFDYHVDRPHPRVKGTMTDDAEWLLNAHSHVLVDAFHATLTALRSSDVGDELDLYYRRAVHLGLVCHGSEIRNPQRHMDSRPESYFHGAPEQWLSTIEAVVHRNEAILADFDGPVFVSTPDLLLDVPRATWLPLVVDVDAWASSPAFEHGGVPVVLHAPSRAKPPIKGSDIVVPVLERLHDEGRIRYVAAENVPHAQMLDLVRSADIVVDQIRTGSYGVAAVEAMAAGRLVVGDVADDVRALLPADVPVVDAPGTQFADALDGVLADLGAAAERAAAGPEYARTWHDGSAAADALAPWLAITTPPLHPFRRSAAR